MATFGLIMMAITPPILLMIITYFIDTKEKEPISLLLALFAMGVASIIPALIVELSGDFFLGLFGFPTILDAFIDAVFIVAFAEECSKFLFMHLIAWKHPAFNYRFDGIVYAVYTSLGFATLENILYVVKNGYVNGIVRALTSVPLHACCGVIMGIFYGHARGCAYAGNKGAIPKKIFLGLLFPILIHGFYDFCLFTENGWLILLWILFTLAIFVLVIVYLIIYSVKDHPIVIPETNKQVFGQPGMWFPQEASQGRFMKWNCACGAQNNSNFCPSCGRARQIEMNQ